MLKIGDKAVEFCLPNQDGIEICLRDLVGKWVILYFYTKDSCSSCVDEACAFTSEIDKFEDANAIVIGVSQDNIKRHRRFIDEKNLEITLLSDKDKEVIYKYDVWQEKKVFGKLGMGVERTTFLINPESKISFIWNKTRVKGHIEKV